MKKGKIAISENPVFFAKKGEDGLFSIFADGNAESVNSEFDTVELVRKYIDCAAHVLKLRTYTLTFSEAEYNCYLGR